MGLGMFANAKTSAKKLPQGDKSLKGKKAPPVGADDNAKTAIGGRETAPNLPMRDGPAKDKSGGQAAGKPPTSAKIKAMRAAIGQMGKF
jgi:hypothetical protein